MALEPEGSQSFWLATSPETRYPRLREDARVDVAVVGAGIVGVLTAFLLKREGRTVALLDAKRIVRGATGFTTAKLTSGHGLVYADLAEQFGEEGARVYADANQAAIERIASLADELGIDCEIGRASCRERVFQEV
jgi:glycine/D-amino acid oxidase-like deaminating enzyme